MFKKNTAGQFIHFQGVDASTGGIKSGVTWTVRRCIDGTFAAATGTVTEDGTTGWYKFAMSQADTNGNNIAFNFTGTGAVPQTLNIVTDGARLKSTSQILDQIEYQRGHHTVTGNTYYVDGYGGDDSTGDGTRALPWKTISKALTAVTSGNHDQIILLPNPAGGPTTITETATISVAKSYVQIRGPGRDVLVTVTSGASKDVFSITASGVGFSGFRIATADNSSNAITVSGGVDFVLMSRLWISSPHQDGVNINVGNRCEISDCVITGAARDGIRIQSGAGSGTYNLMLRNVIRDTVGSAINLQGSDASDCRIQGNIIRDNATGITIASGVVDTVITDNRLVNNTTPISDSGTRTLQQWNYLSTDINGRADVGNAADGALTLANINAQVVDAINTDTYAEPGQGAPPATASLITKIGYLYKLMRNKATQTYSQLSIYNDAGDTVDHKAGVTDDTTTFTRNELESGP